MVQLRKLILLTLLLFLLVACGAKTASETTVTSPDPEIATTEEIATAVATDMPRPTVTAVEVETMTQDDRPSQLRRLTDSWGTNWDKHTIPYSEIMSGGPPRDGIPPIDDPQFVTSAEAADWIAPNEPVIVLEIAGNGRAYPLQILTWHEIVNDEVGGIPVTVTFCPLCNSAIIFDRRLDGTVYDFGTSGLLRNSDLIMYDRQTESLWQQFTGEAIVGDMVGTQLTFLASAIISFADFRQNYPDGQVLSRETGYDRSYGNNPYVGYDNIEQSPFLYDGIPDDRLPPMARVVTVHLPASGIDVAYPLTTLTKMGIINDQQGGQNLAIFHVAGTSSALDSRAIADGRDVGATAVFDPILDEQVLIFNQKDGRITDGTTGSTWNILGQAIDGPLIGKQLNRLVHADHFWFSWAAFRPDTVVYTESR